jgi:hypothetical protein
MQGPIDDSQLPIIDPTLTEVSSGVFQVTSFFAGGRKVSPDGSRVVEVKAWKIDLSLAFEKDNSQSSQASDMYSRLLFEHLEKVSKEMTTESPFLIAYEFEWSDTDVRQLLSLQDSHFLPSASFTLPPYTAACFGFPLFIHASTNSSCRLCFCNTSVLIVVCPVQQFSFDLSM